MPQWRKLHVKATDSLDINDMPDDFTRLLWVMLPLGLDSEGRGLDNSAWVKSKIMPLRTDVTYQDVEAAMEWFDGRGMIERYEIDGRRYFWVPSFRRYQGNTSKEAASDFPPPPSLLTDEAEPTLESSSDLPQTYSGPTLDLLPTNSGPTQVTDVDVDSDVDSDSKTGAGTPDKSPPKPKSRAPTGKNAIKAELELFFAELAALPRPNTSSAAKRKEAGRLWWNPLLEIAKECDYDVERAKNLIAWTVNEMDKQGWNISSPKSILKTARGEQGRRKRNANPNYSNNGRTEPATGPPAVEGEDAARFKRLQAERRQQRERERDGGG